MFRALLQFVSRFVDYKGDWSILALDGVLLIPLGFALFFFPWVVLLGLGAAAIIGVAAFALERAWHTNHPRGLR
jgi:hypothetical protein